MTWTMIILLYLSIVVVTGYIFVGELIISWFPWPAAWVNHMPPLEKEVCLALRNSKVTSGYAHTVKVENLRLWTANSCFAFGVDEPHKIGFAPFWKGYLWRELKLAKARQVISDLSKKEA